MPSLSMVCKGESKKESSSHEEDVVESKLREGEKIDKEDDEGSKSHSKDKVDTKGMVRQSYSVLDLAKKLRETSPE